MHNIRKTRENLIQSCENLVTDRWTDGPINRQTDRQTDQQTDRQTTKKTDKSDFIGCCLTNVERPKIFTGQHGKQCKRQNNQLNQFDYKKAFLVNSFPTRWLNSHLYESSACFANG